MGDFVLKYADGRGQIHQQVATAGSEKELREHLYDDAQATLAHARQYVSGDSPLQTRLMRADGDVPILNEASSSIRRVLSGDNSGVGGAKLWMALAASRGAYHAFAHG